MEPRNQAKNIYDRFSIYQYFYNVVTPSLMISDKPTSRMFKCTFRDQEYLVSFYWTATKPTQITRLVIYHVGAEYNTPLSDFEYQKLYNEIFGNNDVDTRDIEWLLYTFDKPVLRKMMTSYEVKMANFYVKCGILHKGKSDDKKGNVIYYLPSENRIKLQEYQISY